jgi:hypothetical protein
MHLKTVLIKKIHKPENDVQQRNHNQRILHQVEDQKRQNGNLESLRRNIILALETSEKVSKSRMMGWRILILIMKTN